MVIWTWTRHARRLPWPRITLPTAPPHPWHEGQLLGPCWGSLVLDLRGTPRSTGRRLPCPPLPHLRHKEQLPEMGVLAGWAPQLRGCITKERYWSHTGAYKGGMSVRRLGVMKTGRTDGRARGYALSYLCVTAR